MFFQKPLTRLFSLHLLLFIAFFSANFHGIWLQSSLGFILRLLFYCCLVFLIQLAVALLFSKISKKTESKSWILFSALSTINFYSLYLIYQEVFISNSAPLQIFFLMLIGLPISFLYWSSQKNSKAFKFSALSISLLAVVNLAQLLVPDRPTPVTPEIAKILDQWSQIHFSQRPNVHLISCDALISNSLAKKFLNIDKTHYQEVIEKAGGFVAKNVFAAAIASFGSFNSLLRLDDWRIPGAFFMSGESDGPVVRLFHANGYRIATGYVVGSFFGPKGPGVDEYSYNNASMIHQGMMCLKEAKEILWGLGRRHFGFCEVGSYFEPKTEMEHFISYSEWPDQVLRIVKEKSKSGTPWLTIHYMPDPLGHTGGAHNSSSKADYEEYRDWFMERSIRVGKYYEKIVKQIQDTDPNSIVMLFGDHGTFLSRTADEKKELPFIVQDRYGTFASFLKTKNPCSIPDLKKYNPKFVTLGRAFASIIRCLAEKSEEVDNLVHFQQDHSFENYLYE